MLNRNANGVRAEVTEPLIARTSLVLRLNETSHSEPRQAYAALLAMRLTEGTRDVIFSV